MDQSLKDMDGSALVISQFTLLGDTTKGRRPVSVKPLRPRSLARCTGMSLQGFRDKESRLNAAAGSAPHRLVSLKNDGPVTFTLDSKEFDRTAE